MTGLDTSSQVSTCDKPPVLIAGAFLAESTGIRSVCEDLTEGLRARGWSIVTTSGIKSRVPRLIDMLATVWFKRGRYAVAQMDVYSGMAFVWAEVIGLSLAALGCPFILTLHSGAFPDFASRQPARVRRLLRSALVVTSPSSFLQERMAPYRHDIRMVPNGLDISLYKDRRLMRAQPKLVWIRAFEQRYNPVLALEVVARLSNEFPDIELLMVGPDRHDFSAEQVREEAHRLGVDARVRIMGAVPKTDVPRVLQEGDIFLNTTDVDNAPVTVIEAMASGLCVVSTDAGGVPHLVEDGLNTLLVGRDDPDAMAAAVRRILVCPDLASRLSKNARNTANSFDWNRVLPQWEALLAAVAGRDVRIHNRTR